MSKQNTTVSINIDEIPLHLLIARSQTLGRVIDKAREERAYLKGKIAERLAAGESEHAPAEGDAAAPGAVINIKQG